MANHPGPCAADVGLPCRVCAVAKRPGGRKALALLAAPTDCMHRGPATGALVVCTTCTGTRLRVFACAVHGQCTIDRPGEGIAAQCKGCTERTVIGAPELLPGLADPLPVPEVAPVPNGWGQRPDVQRRHREALMQLAAAALPEPSPPGAGDGIVICGGGRYWLMVCLSVRMAREVTDLPIQVWHRGAAEPIEPADLADVPGVTFHDATAFDCRILRGWETKALALIHCGLERVLYLDADAYLVADPRPWLASATADVPFVFFQDLPAQLGRIRWPAWGLADPGIPPVQGGQIAIHRPGAWRSLVLFHWCNQHSDYYYLHGFGDQDCWPPALAAAGTRWRCLGQSPWQSPAYVLPWDGRPLVVHRCRGKLFGTPRDKYEPELPGEPRVWEHRAAHLAAREPVPAAADWHAARLRAVRREERCDNPGGALPGNRVGGLLDLVAAVEAEAGRKLHVLEIGSYKGVSSEALALTCAAVTCLDPWPDEAVFRAFQARMTGYPHVHTVRGTSPGALSTMRAGSFDVVYIDAVHARAELTADIRAAWRVVRPGGWIAGHDYGAALHEVTATVRELLGVPRCFSDSSWLVQRPATEPGAPAEAQAEPEPILESNR